MADIPVRHSSQAPNSAKNSKTGGTLSPGIRGTLSSGYSPRATRNDLCAIWNGLPLFGQPVHRIAVQDNEVPCHVAESPLNFPLFPLLYFPQHCLNFLPLPQGHASLRPTRGCAFAALARLLPARKSRLIGAQYSCISST